MVSLRSDFVNLAVIAGRDVKICGLVKDQIPYVLSPRREVDGGTPGRIQYGLAGFFGVGLCGLRLLRRVVLDLVNLAVRIRSGIDRATGADFERLHLKFLRLEDDGRLSVRSD